MRKQLVAAAVCVSALFLTACGSQTSSNSGKSTKTISLMQNTDLLSLDTSNHADLTQWNVLENSMEGLYRANRQNNPSPAMATSVVKPTNGGKTYTFHLRKNAKWSNGDPVTAKDFVGAWQRSVAPTAKSGYNYIFSGIKNADAITAGKKSAKTLGVKALNQHTLQVQLDHPMPYFNKMMVLPAFFPQDQKTVKKFGKNYGTKSQDMTYNGPFKVTGWNGTNDNWTLKRNTHYYDQSAIKLQQIKMSVVKDSNTAHNLFSEGKLDDALLSGVTAKGLQKNKNLVHVRKAGTYYVRFNLRNGQPLNNQKMRQALNLVVDRQKLATDVLSDGSKPAYTYTSKDLTKDPTTGKDFATETMPSETHNVAQAKKLWQQGMKEAHLKGTVKLQLNGDDEAITKNVAQLLQSEVQSLPNVKVSVNSLPNKAFQDREAAGKFDMEQTLWLADFADPISFMGILESSNPQDYGKYKDAQFDSLFKKAQGSDANQPRKYWADLRAAQKRLNNTMPVLPLYQMVESHLVNPHLKGVLHHPVGEDDYTRAYLTK